MLEGLVRCFSYLELFMKTDNLRAVHVVAAAVLTLAATSPCAEHGHHIVTNFYFARCAGKIPPTFLSPYQLHVPDVPQHVCMGLLSPFLLQQLLYLLYC